MPGVPMLASVPTQAARMLARPIPSMRPKCRFLGRIPWMAWMLAKLLRSLAQEATSRDNLPQTSRGWELDLTARARESTLNFCR